MDLWIRTQDRKNLIKVNKLHLCAETKFTDSIYGSDTKMEYTGNYFIESEGNKLGVYYSEERALEVLDEIQEVIKQRLYIKVNADIKRLDNGCIVYEMPKE